MGGIDVAYIVVVLVGVVSSYFWYDKNKSDKDLTSYKDKSYQELGYFKKELTTKFKELDLELKMIANKQTEHDNKFVTDQRVRDIVQTEVKPLKEDLTSVKNTVSLTRDDVTSMMNSLNSLITEFRVQNAMREYEKSNSQK